MEPPDRHAGLDYTYDLTGAQLSVTFIPTGGVNVTSSVTNAYDYAGRLESECRLDGKCVSYEYDTRGNRTKLTWPDGWYVTYGYDIMGRFFKAKDPAGQFIAFQNFQVLEFTGAQFQTFNVPKAETKGVEIETVYRPTDNITLNGGLTLVDAAYPDDCAGNQTFANVTTLCGNALTNAPKTVGILGATNDGSLGGDYTFFLNGSLRYESDRRTSTQAVSPATGVPLPFDIQEAHAKINLRAGIGNDESGWGLEAWATNITNEITRGVTFGTTLRSGSRLAFIQDPRFYGITARKTF